jgi:hypothetical protein
MGNTGIGILLGEVAVICAVDVIIGASILGGAILYGVLRPVVSAAASARSCTRIRRERRDDPQKRAAR